MRYTSSFVGRYYMVPRKKSQNDIEMDLSDKKACISLDLVVGGGGPGTGLQHF